MAAYTVTITVTNGAVSIDHPTEDVNAGDTISFSSNQTAYVVFDAGQWPFTNAQPSNLTITVGNSAGPYTVANDPGTVDDYEVRLSLSGAAKAQGHVDIEDDPEL
jgi:hypothetical protein